MLSANVISVASSAAPACPPNTNLRFKRFATVQGKRMLFRACTPIGFVFPAGTIASKQSDNTWRIAIPTASGDPDLILPKARIELGPLGLDGPADASTHQEVGVADEPPPGAAQVDSATFNTAIGAATPSTQPTSTAPQSAPPTNSTNNNLIFLLGGVAALGVVISLIKK